LQPAAWQRITQSRPAGMARRGPDLTKPEKGQNGQNDNDSANDIYNVIHVILLQLWDISRFVNPAAYPWDN